MARGLGKYIGLKKAAVNFAQILGTECPCTHASWTNNTSNGFRPGTPGVPYRRKRGHHCRKKQKDISRGLVSRQPFGPKFCVVWPRKMPASGWGSLWESSSFVPWFSTFLFRNVPGTVPECVVICWFKRNSSNLDRAPKMRDSVRLNSWDSFLVTLPSICSETCVIYSSLILGTDVFRDWPFLGFSSCVSLVTAANFRLFFRRCHFWRENATQLWRLN